MFSSLKAYHCDMGMNSMPKELWPGSHLIKIVAIYFDFKAIDFKLYIHLLRLLSLILIPTMIIIMPLKLLNRRQIEGQKLKCSGKIVRFKNPAQIRSRPIGFKIVKIKSSSIVAIFYPLIPNLLKVRRAFLQNREEAPKRAPNSALPNNNINNPRDSKARRIQVCKNLSGNFQNGRQISAEIVCR